MNKKEERNYLSKIYNTILQQLEELNESLEFTENEIKKQNKDMWETVSSTPNNLKEMDGLVQAKVFLDSIKRSQRIKSSKEKRKNNLMRMKKSAYFGRIDIDIENEGVEKIYIGMSNLTDKEDYDILIYDWRAPVCSVFYDRDLGEIEYEAPNGKISGELLLRRQFKIKEDQILYMFDSNLKIDDEILMETLSGNADDKMKTIVMTIQKTQNRIIRDEKDEVIISMGPAGSGKTSIALHRIAYLMYRHRKELKPQEILILSPNNIFSSYIGNVLPELGEENVGESTLVEILEKFIPSEYNLQTFSQYMESILTKKDMERYENIKIKSSDEFLYKLDEYIQKLETEIIEFEDIVYDNRIVISKDSLAKMYTDDKAYFNPVQRLERIETRIVDITKPYRNKEFKRIYNEIMDSKEYFSKGEAKRKAKILTDEKFADIDKFIDKISNINFVDLYLSFIKEKYFSIYEITNGQFFKKYFLYEDIAPYAYFLISLGKLKTEMQKKQIVIDEIQDYPSLSIKLIYMLFPKAKFTMLGDPNQLVNKGITEYSVKNLKKIFNNRKLVTINLNKSYRSTIEIFNFCKNIIDPKSQQNIKGVLRHGEKPKVIKTSDITSDIQSSNDDFLKEGFKSIAIITKTATQADEIYDKIKEKYDNINLIDNEETLFKQGITVIPCYLAKGLEVDCVIIENANNVNYQDSSDRKILYTIASRALHRLHIYYKKELTDILKFNQ